jgi:hypothetical protein
VRFPATAPIDFGVKIAECGIKDRGAALELPHSAFISRAPACAAESPKLSLPGAAPGRLANLSWGRGRKVMHLPCKQTQAGALPAVLHHFIAGRMRFRRAS